MIRTAVAVIGSGTSGAATAALVARVGLPTVLIGRPAYFKGFSQTLSSRSRPTLARIHASLPIRYLGLPACLSKTSAWGSSAVGEVESIFNPFGPDRFAGPHSLEDMLIESAVDSGALPIPFPMLSARPSEQAWDLRLSDGSAINARFVIDASGRTSSFARKTGAMRRRIDRLSAAVVPMHPAGGQTSATFVESVADGWWYLGFPSNGEANAIYFSDSDLPGARATARIEGWKTALRNTVHARQMLAGTKGEPVVLRASSDYLSPCAGSNWLAVGDSQATCDPLSSEGLLQGLESAEQAATAVVAFFNGNAHATRIYRLSRELAYVMYLSDRARVYGMERRWRQSPFWERRCPTPEPTQTERNLWQSPKSNTAGSTPVLMSLG